MMILHDDAGLPHEAEPYEEPFEMIERAGPWPRYWARMLDLLLGIAVLSFVAGILWPAFFSTAERNFTAISIVLIPIAMCVEAGVMTLFGTTLGKAIAGIRVETIDHRRPTLGTLFVRNMRVWFFGLAAGIPIIALGTLSHNYRKVSAGDRTSWDEDQGTGVFEAGSSLARTVIVAVLYIGILGGLVALGSIEQSPHDELLAAIPELNRDLPKTVDDATVLNRVSVDASTLIYDYTLTNRDGSTMSGATARDVATRFSTLEATNRSSMCRAKSTNLLGSGISMRYRYSAEGGVIVDFTVTPADCA